MIAVGSLFQRLIPDGLQRALVAKAARWLSGIAAGAVGGWCLTHGVQASEATEISAAVGSLILAGLPAIYSWLDAKHVQKQINSAVAISTAAVASGDPREIAPAAEAIKKGLVITVGQPSGVPPSAEASITRALNQTQVGGAP